jgi:hypothetical protein
MITMKQQTNKPALPLKLETQKETLFNCPTGVQSERSARGGPCWLLKLRQIWVPIEYNMKGVIPGLVASVQDIFVLPRYETLFSSLHTIFKSTDYESMRQVTQHGCLPSLLGDGDKEIQIVYGEEKNIFTGPTRANQG